MAKLYYFPSVIELSSLNRYTGVKINGALASDRTGYSVSFSGDFNNDKYKDILIGSLINPNGKSYVIFGNITIGNNGIFELSSINGFNGVVFNSASTTYSGYPVSAIDINIDGNSDIIIGNPLDASYTGKTYIIFGGKGIGNTTGGVINLSTISSSNAFSITGATSGDHCGMSFFRGDFDNDGFDDLSIGAFAASPSGRTNAGIGYVLKSRTGIGSGGTLSISSLNGATGYSIYSPSAGKYLGLSTTAGDINNDGIKDVIFGSSEGAGSTYVVFGKNGTRPAVLDLASLNTLDFLTVNGAGSENSGRSIGAGDFNGDGYTDLLIGSPFSSPDGKSQAGTAFIILGPRNGTTINLANFNNSYRINGVTAGDQMGCSVGSAGDFNHDNITDLFIGSGFGTPNGRNRAGITYVIFGSPNITSGGSLDLFNLTGTNGIQFNGQVAGDYAGSSDSGTIAVSGLGDVNGDKVDDIVIGANFASPGGRNGAGTSYVVFGDASPEVVRNNFLISDGESRTLNETWLNITDFNHDKSTFTYSISNVANGYISFVNSSTPISSFNHSLLANNRIQFVHSGNHLLPLYSIGVNTTGFAYLPPQPANITFRHTIPPYLLANNFTIIQGRSTVLDMTNFNASSIYPHQNPLDLILNPVGLQYLRFNSSVLNSTVSQFRLRDVQNSKVTAIHDGTRNTPTGSISVIDDTGLASTPVPMNIHYIPRPEIINKSFSIKQGETKVLGISNFWTECDVSVTASETIYTLTDVQFGRFAYVADTATPITTFTQQEINDDLIAFVQDNTNNIPTFTVSVQDKYGSIDGPFPVSIASFHDRPRIGNNNWLLKQGRNTVLTPAQLSVASNFTINQEHLYLNISDCRFVEIWSLPQTSIINPLDQLITMGNITRGDIEARTDGSTNLPSCKISVSDDILNGLFVENANINFHRAPNITLNRISINQGQTVVLGPQFLNAVDTNGGDGSALVYSVTGLDHVLLTQTNQSSYIISNFTHGVLTQGGAQLIHDDSIISPEYYVSVSDGVLTNIEGPILVNVDQFYLKPSLVNNTATILQGGRLRLTTSNLAGFDPNGFDPRSLRFILSGLDHVNFENASNPSIALTNLQQSNIEDLEIDIVHDDSIYRPSYNVTVYNPMTGLYKGPYPAQLAFHPRPRIDINNWYLFQGMPTTLTPAQLSVSSDITSDPEQLLICFINCQNATIWSFPQNRFYNFATMGNITRGDVQVRTNGSPSLPSCELSVSDGTLSSATVNANINFHRAPLLLTNRIAINQGQTVVLGAEFLNAMDANGGDSALLVYSVTGLDHVLLTQTNQSSYFISNFTHGMLTQGDAQLIHDDSINPPQYYVSVSDGVLTNIEDPVSVNVDQFFLKPYLVNNTATILQGGRLRLTTSNLAGFDPNPGSDPGNLVLIINAADHVTFENTSNPSISLTNLQQAGIMDGEIDIVHDDSIYRPSYNVTVYNPITGLYKGPYFVQPNFHAKPIIDNNNWYLKQGRSTTLTLDQLSVSSTYTSDPEQLLINFINCHNATIWSIPQNRYHNFATMGNITRGDVEVRTDGSPNEPGCQISVSDGTLSSATVNANINFHRAPLLLTNRIAIDQGQTVILGPQFLNAMDANGRDSSLLTYYFTNLNHVVLTQANQSHYVISNFTQGFLNQGAVQLLHDDSINLPQYYVSVSDGVLSNIEGPILAIVDRFYFKPELLNNTITLLQGMRLRLSTSNLAARDPNNIIDPRNLRFIVNNLQHVQFENRTNTLATTDFPQSAVIDSIMELQHDNSANRPDYNVTVFNPATGLFKGPFRVIVNFDATPFLLNNYYLVRQYEMMRFNDTYLYSLDDNSDPACRLLNFTKVLNAEILSNYTGTLVPTRIFPQKNSTRGDIYLAQNGAPNAPYYEVEVIDCNGQSRSVPEPVASTSRFIIVNPAPELGNNNFRITQGQSFTLSTADISASDIKSPPSNIIFHFNEIDMKNCYFSRGNSNLPIFSFSLEDVQQSRIRLTPTGDKYHPPQFKFTITNQAGISIGPFDSVVSYNSLSVAPTIIKNELSIKQDETVTLTEDNINVASQYDNIDEIDICVTPVKHCDLISVVNGVEQQAHCFKMENVTAGHIQIRHDGEPEAPGYTVTAIGPASQNYPMGLASQPQQANIDFTLVDKLPEVVNNRFTVTRGQADYVSSENLLAIDPNKQTPNSELIFSIINPEFCRFESGVRELPRFRQGLLEADVKLRSLGNGDCRFNFTVTNPTTNLTTPSMAARVNNLIPAALSAAGTATADSGFDLARTLYIVAGVVASCLTIWLKKRANTSTKDVEAAAKKQTLLLSAEVMLELNLAAWLKKWGHISENKITKYFNAINSLLLDLRNHGILVDNGDLTKELDRKFLAGIIVSNIRNVINGPMGCLKKFGKVMCRIREIQDKAIKINKNMIVQAILIELVEGNRINIFHGGKIPDSVKSLVAKWQAERDGTEQPLSSGNGGEIGVEIEIQTIDSNHNKSIAQKLSDLETEMTRLKAIVLARNGGVQGDEKADPAGVGAPVLLSPISSPVREHPPQQLLIAMQQQQTSTSQAGAVGTVRTAV